MVARYGGKEFALVLTATNIGGAIAIDPNIQQAMAAQGIVHHGSEVSRYVALSIGITSQVPQPGSTAKQLSLRPTKRFIELNNKDAIATASIQKPTPQAD